VSGCAPRAREDIVRPPRLIGASGRPLNFTVRRPAQGGAKCPTRSLFLRQ